MINKTFENYYHENCFLLDHRAILVLAKESDDGRINNVISGLHNKCYGLAIKDKHKPIFQLCYINGRKELRGNLLQLDLHYKDRDRLLFVFSEGIAAEFGHDVVGVFNTFQDMIRTTAEQLGYVSVNPLQFLALKGQNPTLLIKAKKGVIFTPILTHVDIYRSIFGECLVPDAPCAEINYVYLMFNKQNKFIKIGKSIQPLHRERTLQAQAPDIVMIAMWKAPGVEETKLHRKYKDKRERGEWYALNFNDLKDINIYMGSLNN